MTRQGTDHAVRMADNSSQYARPMRLGTRSCVECRRRKVRCIFESSESRCRQCKAHGTTCRAQGTKRAAGEERRETTSSHRNSELFENGILTLSPALTSGTAKSATPSVNQASIDVHAGEDEIASEACQAPLLEYVRTALQVTPSSETSKLGRNRSDSASTKFDMPPCPDLAALIEIFQSTEPFWATWPLAATVEQGTISSGFPYSVVDAITFVHDSLRSQDLGDVAKCLSWLALCFFQLPANLAEAGRTKLPMPKSTLSTRYLRQASALVGECIDSGSRSLAIIETLAVQFKCYVDLARPHQAWRCIRRAIDHALLLGLDRIQGSTTEDQYRRSLWMFVWGADRRLALFLGLPYAVADHLAIPMAGLQSPNSDGQIMYRLLEICGRIIDRNRSMTPPYSVTTRIAEEMDALKAQIPEAWWEMDRTVSDSPKAAVFHHRVAVFTFHHMIQLLHLPYVLEARHNDRYRYSRDTFMSSTKLMLRTWAEFSCLNEIPFACDYLDFCAFHAVVILATDLLSTTSSWSTEEEQRSWKLIASTAVIMQHKADVLGCTVPAQSAEVLRRLHAAQHNTYPATEVYEVVIPCFGRISIRPPSMAKSTLHTDFESISTTTFDLDINFDSTAFGFGFPLELDPTFELAGNWSPYSTSDTGTTLI